MSKKAPIVLLLCLSLVWLSGWLTGCSTVPQPNTQAAADPSLLAEIAKIKAIDNHAHPWRVVKEGEEAECWLRNENAVRNVQQTFQFAAVSTRSASRSHQPTGKFAGHFRTLGITGR